METSSFRFDFCKDTNERRPTENLGQVLFGERIETSPYKVRLYLYSLYFTLLVKVTFGRQ